MSKKIKWTLIDTLIVILVIVAGVALMSVFGKKTATGDMKKIEAVVLIANEETYVGDALAVGDEITISLTEKDSGTLKAVEIKDAEAMTFNSIDGTYATEPIEGKVDIYATVELLAAENNFAFTCGSTKVKVGEKMPFRSKGYALEGFVVEINEKSE